MTTKQTFPAPAFAGFLQAIGIIVYVMFIAGLAHTLANSMFLTTGVTSLVLPLLLLCISALVCTCIAFWYPVVLLLQQRKWEAFAVMFSMIMTLGLSSGILILIAQYSMMAETMAM